MPDLYIGKWREIWGEELEPIVIPKQIRRKGGSLLLVDLPWKNALGEELEKHYAPIDIRSPDRFYEGTIKNFSSFTRALDDKTGLFKVSDATLTLANQNKGISKLLGSYYLRDQICSVYHAWRDEPESWRAHIIDFVVVDHDLNGTDFDIKLKDITQSYFKKKLPLEICTIDDWPNIHPDHVGRYKPELIGYASKTTGEARGAVEAVYVDITGPPYRYLASRGELHNVLNVYSNNGLVNPANWAFVAGPPSLLNLTNDQGDATITYNGQGYEYGIWNDPADGYIRNPAYVLLYFLHILLGIPLTRIDIASIDDIAARFISRGEEKSGYLILQDNRDSMEFLREMLFTYGIKSFIRKGGDFTIGRKDLTNWATDVHLFEQIDSIDPISRMYNLDKAINTAKARWNFIPWCREWLGGMEKDKPNYWPGGEEDDIRKGREQERETF